MYMARCRPILVSANSVYGSVRNYFRQSFNVGMLGGDNKWCETVVCGRQQVASAARMRTAHGVPAHRASRPSRRSTPVSTWPPGFAAEYIERGATMQRASSISPMTWFGPCSFKRQLSSHTGKGICPSNAGGCSSTLPTMLAAMPTGTDIGASSALLMVDMVTMNAM